MQHIQVKDNVLTHTQNETRKWFNYKIPSKEKMTIYITVPKTWVIDYKIKTHTGNIEIINIEANILDVSISTGALLIKDVTGQNITTKNQTGETRLTNIHTNQIIAEVSTGIIVANDVMAQKIQLTNQTGDIRITGSYSNYSLDLKTNTGSIHVDHKHLGKSVVAKRSDESIIASTKTGSIKLNNK